MGRGGLIADGSGYVDEGGGGGGREPPASGVGSRERQKPGSAERGARPRRWRQRSFVAVS